MPAHSTPSQTVGPFFSIGFDWLNNRDVPAEISGERVTIHGRVLDGDAQPVPDAVLEIWQADADGRYHHPEHTNPQNDPAPFFGFSRVPTDEHGQFSFATIKPGPTPGPDGKPQAPHLQISLFMRGLLKRLVTRIYFPDDLLNESDLVLRAVPESRRATLIARQSPPAENALAWNVCLQGQDETVFFDC